MGVDVGAAVHPVAGAVGQGFDVLWGHVGQRAAEGRGDGGGVLDPGVAGEAEVEEH